MNVGDKMMSGKQVVTVRDAEPDANGEITVRNAGGFNAQINPASLTPMAETEIVDTPSGRYEIVVPSNGDSETTAVLLEPAVRG